MSGHLVRVRIEKKSARTILEREENARRARPRRIDPVLANVGQVERLEQVDERRYELVAQRVDETKESYVAHVHFAARIRDLYPHIHNSTRYNKNNLRILSLFDTYDDNVRYGED